MCTHINFVDYRSREGIHGQILMNLSMRMCIFSKQSDGCSARCIQISPHEPHSDFGKLQWSITAARDCRDNFVVLVNVATGQVHHWNVALVIQTVQLLLMYKFHWNATWHSHILRVVKRLITPCMHVSWQWASVCTLMVVPVASRFPCMNHNPQLIITYQIVHVSV